MAQEVAGPLVFVADAVGIKTGGGPRPIDDAVTRTLIDLPGSTSRWVRWPAGYGPPGSWDRDATYGAMMLIDMMEKNPNRPFILYGYSGGCLVIRKAMDRMPDRLKQRVISIGLLADPHRPRDGRQMGIMDPTTGWGVCGALVPSWGGTRTFWTTHPLDPVSNPDPDSISRTVAAQTDILGGNTAEFFTVVMHTLHSRQLQLWRERAQFARSPIHWTQTIGDRVDRGVQEVLNFSVRGYHTTAYTEPWNDGRSLSERLGATVSHKAQKELAV